MAVYTLTNIGRRISAAIKRTNDQYSTGPTLQGLLHDIVDSLKRYVDSAIVDSSAPTILIVSDTVMISEGAPYSVAFAEMEYDMTFNFYDDDGPVGGHFTNSSSTGFTVVSDVDCTFTFICVKKQI